MPALPPLKPWWFCCGWRSYWCVLDVVTFCKIKAVCDRHDRWITGVDFYEDDEPAEKIRSAFESGEKGVTGPAYTVLACPDGGVTIAGPVKNATCLCGQAMVQQEVSQ